MAAQEQKENQAQEKETEILSWTAPSRPFKRRNREFYVTVIAIAGIIGLVFFLTEGFMPVILIASIVFLFYVLNTVPPEKVEYKITNKGIKIADKKTDWGVVLRFWFTRRFDNTILILETLTLPGRLEFIVIPEDKEKIKEALLKYIPEEKTPPSGLDRAANWVAKKLPGERA